MRVRRLVVTTTALCLSATPLAARPQDAAPAIKAQAGDPPKTDLKSFVAQMAVPNERFTLPNGLNVIVLTDRTTPKVAVSVWYNVGSKHEPEGKSGFAHLFEHLMFNGTENVPGDFLKPLTEAGATNLNGGTSYDFTNYHETVPTGALSRALFMEADRMGHLLGAVDQAVLDEQRGVVKNEKRQRANNPVSDVNDKVTQTLFPGDHPYGHSPIGSMADLDAADLDDVRAWFHNRYGPNNATLILAGDIDVPTAKSMVTRYFGDIPAGPANVAPPVTITTLPRRLEETTTAPVSLPIIRRLWAVPGNISKDSLALDAAAGVISGIDDSPLQRILVREKKLFNHIVASNDSMVQAGTFRIAGEVARGVDPAAAARALDDLIARFLEQGATADDLNRWKTSFILSQARSRENLESRAALLGISAIALGDPDGYIADLAYLADLTPEPMIAIARKWLGRPVYALTVVPGPRVSVETDAPGIAAGANALPPPPAPPIAVATARGPRLALPGVGDVGEVRFPAIEHGRLSNGIAISYVNWTATPFTTVAMAFDAGATVDPVDRRGRQALMFELVDDGIAGHDARWIKARQERLGILSGGGVIPDGASIATNVPTINFTAAIDLLGDMVKHPTFPQDELDQAKRQRLASIEGERTNPVALIFRTLPKLINANTPYPLGTDPQSIKAMTRDDLMTAHRQWVRPEKAKLFVMSDRPLAELQPALEREFGDWTVSGAAGVAPPVAAPDPAPPQILLIDHPSSTQTTIYGGQRVAVADSDEMVPLRLANTALGGGFQSRINQDLRETKHWAYGASGAFDHKELETTYNVSTSVQKDKSGPAVAAVRQITRDFLSEKPMTPEELKLARDNALRMLGTRFADGNDVFATMMDNDRHDRPDDYYVHLPARYRAMTLDELNQAMRGKLDVSRWVWVVVGDAKLIRPQLDTLGLPIKTVAAASVVPAGNASLP